jgi:hypothetical protein
VVVTLTVSEAITATPSGRTLSGTNIYTKTYNTNGSETVNFTDIAGNAGEVDVNVTNIEKTAPTVTFGTNGNSTYKTSQSTTVTVSDGTGAGVDTSSLKYQRTTNTSEPADGSFSSTFTNEQTITKSDGD